MVKFSERMGFKKPKFRIQKRSMDEDLRIGLWNVITMNVWELNKGHGGYMGLSYRGRDLIYSKEIKFDLTDVYDSVTTKIWKDFFKFRIDQIPKKYSEYIERIACIFKEMKWYEIYDLLEFIADNYKDDKNIKKFFKDTNQILEREFSAYRFVSGKIVPITSDTEIEEVESATSTPHIAANKHINTSLELLSDKKNPDYRNSIKESISAVEAMCKTIVGEDKATLGEALKIIGKQGNLKIHGALKEAFSKLYGYTNDEKGLRHSLMGEDRIQMEDAKFMLVACSAFVNYLVVKSSKSKE